MADEKELAPRPNHSSSEETTQRPATRARRVPAASTDGQHISSTPNSGTPTRRRRVFIVSEEEQQMHSGRPAARPRVQSTPTTTALTPPRQSALAMTSAIRQSVLMAAIATTTTAPSAPIALQPQVSPVRVSLTRGSMQARAPRRAVHLQHLRQRRKRSSHSSPYQ